MKKLLFVAFTTLALFSVEAQTLSKITLNETGNVLAISYDLDESVQLNISQEGVLGEWGVDLYRGRADNLLRKLETYTGRTEYYTELDNEAFRGKLKYIGRTLITYYAASEDETHRGKIKSIGNINFDYYQKFENVAIKGRIKKAGPAAFSYFPSFGNDPNAGKLQKISNTTLTYYGQFDDNFYKGKIKSIGSLSFIYYGTSETNKQLRGRLKSGSNLQVVNGIRFYVKM